MPQNPTNITDSTEFKEFCKNNNLDVLNLESINVFLYATYNSYKVLSGAFLDNDEALTKLEEENKHLREMIMEIAKNININKLHPEVEWCHPKYDGTETLFDKWNTNEHSN